MIYMVIGLSMIVVSLLAELYLAKKQIKHFKNLADRAVTAGETLSKAVEQLRADLETRKKINYTFFAKSHIPNSESKDNPYDGTMH